MHSIKTEFRVADRFIGIVQKISPFLFKFKNLIIAKDKLNLHFYKYIFQFKKFNFKPSLFSF